MNKEKVNMKKKIIRKNIGKERMFDAEYYSPIQTTIDEVLEWLNETKKQGATHIDWNALSCDGESSEVVAQAYLEYEETDEECLEREAEEKAKQDELKREQLQLARMEYERLKKKFEV